jgi:hypothetical protein
MLEWVTDKSQLSIGGFWGMFFVRDSAALRIRIISNESFDPTGGTATLIVPESVASFLVKMIGK